jgi:hypothetical protein
MAPAVVVVIIITSMAGTTKGSPAEWGGAPPWGLCPRPSHSQHCPAAARPLPPPHRLMQGGPAARGTGNSSRVMLTQTRTPPLLSVSAWVTVRACPVLYDVGDPVQGCAGALPLRPLMQPTHLHYQRTSRVHPYYVQCAQVPAPAPRLTRSPVESLITRMRNRVSWGIRGWAPEDRENNVEGAVQRGPMSCVCKAMAA